MPRKAPLYNASLRCHYKDGMREVDNTTNYTQHYRSMPLRDLPKWIEAYKFTHPGCDSISIKLWLTDVTEGGNG